MNAATIGSNLLAILADPGGPAALVARWTILLASAWLAHALLARRNPRWRVLLWRGTITGLVLVAALSARSPIVSLPVVPPVREVAVEPAVSLAPTAHSEPVRPSAVMPVRAVRVEAGPVGSRPEPVLDIEPAAARAPSPSPTPIVVSVVSWLPAVWLAGMLFLSGRLVLSSLALRQLLGRATDAPDAILGECRAIAARLGHTRPVRVACSDEVNSPCLAGVLRPVLLLSSECQAPDDLPAILAHELAHAKNRDLAWNLAAHVASIVLWFHPLAWRIRSVHTSACDAVSDAIAADHLGDVVAYGRTLARLAVAAASSPPSPAPVLAMARTSEVWRRLDALNRRVFGAPLSRRVILPAMALGGLLLVLIGGFGVTRAAQDPKAARAKATPEVHDPDVSAGRIVLRAVEGATGEPIGGASIEFLLYIGGVAQKSTASTAEDGTATIEWKAGAKVERLHVTARAAGFAPVMVVWSRDRHPKGLPAEKLLRFERGVAIGGVVKDAEGQPIAGATVDLSAQATDSDWNDVANFGLGSVPTDDRGRWRLEHAPRDLGHVWVSATKPGYRQRAYNMVAAVGSDSVIVLERGLTLTGRVVDAQGRPVRGARAVLTCDRWGSSGPFATSDDDGRLAINNCDPGVVSLGVQARGFAPLMREVRIEAKMAPVEVRLTGPGKSMRARVVDVAGRPVAGALVAAESWRGRAALEFRTHTDANGRFAWSDAPADAVLFSILKPGYMASRETSLQATDREQTVVLHPKLVITGKVTDATTGRPVNGFRVVQGRPIVGEAPTEINWSGPGVEQGPGGKYRTEFDEPSELLYVRIEAPGYRIVPSRGFRPDESNRTLDFSLEPAKAVSGIVRLPDGRPAEAVAVALATPKKHVALHDGRFNGDAGMPRVTTAADGRFAFAAPDGPFTVIAAGDAGFADAFPDELARTGTLVLQPWGRIEGGLRIGARSGANQAVAFYPTRLWRSPGPFVFSYGYETRTDDRGRFTLDRVIPGQGMVSRVVITEVGGGEMNTPGWNERVEVPPGGTAEVKIGGKGRPVTGRLAIEGTPEFPVDWTHQEPVILEAVREKGATALDSTYRVAANLEKDRHFRIDDVPSGTYQMRLRVKGTLPPGSGGGDAEVGQVERSVEVPPIPGGRSNEPLELGTIPVRLNETLEVGDPAPEFAVRRIGEGAGADDQVRLVDSKGKLVLVEFRASWYEHQSRSDLHAMIDLHQALGGDPRFRMISLWCDPAPEPAEQIIIKEALAWTQGYAGPFRSPVFMSYKLRSSRATFLVGPDGCILAKNLRGAELRAAVEKALKEE
ncbi:MAG: carboxypeptidase regulatory-like domain-containing protein [Isosphaeraceae bacterium]